MWSRRQDDFASRTNASITPLVRTGIRSLRKPRYRSLSFAKSQTGNKNMDQRKRAATTSGSAIVNKASALAVTICARRVANYRYVHGNGCALRDQVVTEGELAVQLGFSPHLAHPVKTAATLRFARGGGCFQRAGRNFDAAALLPESRISVTKAERHRKVLLLGGDSDCDLPLPVAHLVRALRFLRRGKLAHETSPCADTGTGRRGCNSGA